MTGGEWTKQWLEGLITEVTDNPDFGQHPNDVAMVEGLNELKTFLFGNEDPNVQGRRYASIVSLIGTCMANDHELYRTVMDYIRNAVLLRQVNDTLKEIATAVQGEPVAAKS